MSEFPDITKILTSKLPPLRAWDGVQTRDLVKQPGAFGLGKVPSSVAPNATTTAVCGFCSTGCGLNIHLKDGQATNLTADTNYPVNLGMACPKGWEALAPLSSTDRATVPMLRSRGDKEGKAIDWETAARVFTERFQAIKAKHGADSLAFLSTGQIVTEEMAFLGSLAKFGFGFAHGDGNTRQCMATSVVAYKQSFGFDAPPYTYQDFEESDVLVFVGSNPCIAHPIMWQRVLRNPHSPEIIVVDPRKTETAVAGTQHYGLAPRSDLTLLYGIAHLLIKGDHLDHDFINAHTNGYKDFAAHVESYTPGHVAEVTGLSEEQLHGFADTVASGKRVSFWWTMGVNQGYEATRTAQAIINLALITGNIGRPGTGANSITGQCNAMGSRLFSNTTGLLGGRDFTNAEHRAEVADTLEIPESKIPQENCLAYDQIIDGIEEGRIKGLWVIATNTAHSWTARGRLKDLLHKLDFFVVQDMYGNTETAQLADLVFPAAGWGEKDGTFINSERRIGLVKKVSKAPGQALSDYSIFRLLASAWSTETARMFRNWTSPEETFKILTKLSKGRPCDVSGIANYAAVDEAGGIQWPCPEGTVMPPEPQRRLFEDRKFYHPDGRAKLLFESPRKNPEPTDDDYPFTLLTGRGTSAQWHTGTRTAKSAVLRRLYPKSIYVEIHPDDALVLEIAPGSKVKVASRRGTVTVTAVVTPTVGKGQIFLPMHYTETNLLTLQVVDPYSRQPSYKACAVKLESV